MATCSSCSDWYSNNLSCCPSCGCVSTIQSTENGPVHTVAHGKAARVSDRNGNPKDVVPVDNSLFVGHDSKAKFADGSADNPVLVDFQTLAYGRKVVVQSDGKVIAVVQPEDTADAFFGQKGGVVKFFKDRQDNIFSSLLGRTTGKLAILGCEADGSLSLEFLSGLEGYIKVDEDGNVEVVESLDLSQLCDLEEIEDSEDISAHIVCTDEGLRKYVPPETVDATGEQQYAGVDTGYTGAVVGIPTINFVLPDTHTLWEVRLDAAVAVAGTVGSAYVFKVNGTNLITCGGSAPIAPWFGSCECDGQINGMATHGWGLGKLANGAHTFTLEKCPAGNRLPLRIALTAQWRPIS